MRVMVNERCILFQQKKDLLILTKEFKVQSILFLIEKVPNLIKIFHKKCPKINTKLTNERRKERMVLS